MLTFPFLNIFFRFWYLDLVTGLSLCTTCAVCFVDEPIATHKVGENVTYILLIRFFFFFFFFLLCMAYLTVHIIFSVTSYIKDHYHIPQTLMLTFALPTYDVIYQRPPPIREYLKQYGITIEVQVCLSSFIYESLVTPSGQGVC